MSRNNGNDFLHNRPLNSSNAHHRRAKLLSTMEIIREKIQREVVDRLKDHFKLGDVLVGVNEDTMTIETITAFIHVGFQSGVMYSVSQHVQPDRDLVKDFIANLLAVYGDDIPW